jgi:hypothetical protein
MVSIGRSKKSAKRFDKLGNRVVKQVGQGRGRVLPQCPMGGRSHRNRPLALPQVSGDVSVWFPTVDAPISESNERRRLRWQRFPQEVVDREARRVLCLNYMRLVSVETLPRRYPRTQLQYPPSIAGCQAQNERQISAETSTLYNRKETGATRA